MRILFYRTEIRLETLDFEQQYRSMCGTRRSRPLLVGLACALRTAGRRRRAEQPESTGGQSRAFESTARETRLAAADRIAHAARGRGKNPSAGQL